MGKKNLQNKLIAVFYGILCHTIFALAGLIMFWTLLNGFSTSIGTVSYPFAIISNLVLLVQFPFIHSFLLSKKGKFIIKYFAPSEYAKVLATTIYVAIASLQLLALFILWSPSGIVLYKLEFPYNIANLILFTLSWGLLSLSSFQAGYKVQTGLLGWTALFFGTKPVFPPMPKHGVFSLIRQPIYLSFCLVLWTSPFMTLDLLLVAIFYSAYCYLAPKFKERRFAALYGEHFRNYQKKVPYFFPKIFKVKESDYSDT